MTSTNLNIILTNAVCCASKQAAKVAKLYSIGYNCVDEEVQKLALINDQIEILKCYQIDPIQTGFTLKLTYAQYNNLNTTAAPNTYEYSIVTNKNFASIIGDNITTKLQIMYNLLYLALPGCTINTKVDSINKSSRYVFINVLTDCDITYIKYISTFIETHSSTTSNFILYQQGNCIPTNCLTESNFNILVANLMATCDICECQLTQ